MQKFMMFAMIIIISISPFFRGLFYDFEANAFMTVLALLSVFYFISKLGKKEAIYFNRWILLFGSLFVAAYSLSFINAVNVRENIASLLQVIGYLIVSITLYDYYHDKKEKFVYMLMIPVIIMSFISAVLGLAAEAGTFQILNNPYLGIESFFQYKNTASIYYIIGLIFSLTIINSSKKIIPNIILTGTGPIFLIAMVLTGCKGGYIVLAMVFLLLVILQPSGNKLQLIGSIFCMGLPAVVFMKPVSNLVSTFNYIAIGKLLVLCYLISLFLGLILSLTSKLLAHINHIKPFGVIFSIFLVLILAILAFLSKDKISINTIIPQNILKELDTFDLSSLSFSSRTNFYKDSIKIIRNHWLFGLGGGGWDALYYSVQETFYIARDVHNHFLQIFVESGILGFLSFTSIILTSLYSLFRSIFKSKEIKQRIYIIGLFGALLALSSHSFIDFNLSYVSMSLFLWTLITGAAIFADDISQKEAIVKKAPFCTNKNVVLIILLVISSALSSINGLYTTASYNAEKGLAQKGASNYKAARAYYEEAYRLDPLNSEYTFELTKLYNYFAKISSTPENIQAWRMMAIDMAEKSIELNPYLAENLRVMTRTYFDADMPVEALYYAERLIKYQPCNPINYELLARGYWDAAQYYFKNQNIEKATELLLLCSEIDTPSSVKINKTILSYNKKALEQLNQLGAQQSY